MFMTEIFKYILLILKWKRLIFRLSLRLVWELSDNILETPRLRDPAT